MVFLWKGFGLSLFLELTSARDVSAFAGAGLVFSGDSLVSWTVSSVLSVAHQSSSLAGFGFGLTGAGFAVVSLSHLSSSRFLELCLSNDGTWLSCYGVMSLMTKPEPCDDTSSLSLGVPSMLAFSGAEDLLLLKKSVFLPKSMPATFLPLR